MQHRYSRLLAATAIPAVAALALGACSGGTTNGAAPIASAAPTALTGTISVWHGWSDREAAAFQGVIDDFEAANPGVKVEVHSGQDDSKLAKVISTGGDVDVALSSSIDNLGTFCSSGAFRDLGPLISRDGVDLTQIPDTFRKYTAFEGTQCSLPVLADVYGLYYNTDLLSAAGYTAPPKTFSELQDMALKLTTYNADGSIKTLGFNPLLGYYENTATQLAPTVGATWTKDGKSAIDSPAWKDLLTWQKGFVDAIGYDKLKTFTAGLGDEWSADNAFQTGQVAMNLDGEWRTAFIADQAPDLKYATAPFPTADNHTDLYGGGYATGTVAGIAKDSKNPEAAWALIKYLSLNTDAVVKLANGIKNVPTTTAALASPNLQLPPEFTTFLDIAGSPHAMSSDITRIGSTSQTTFETYWHTYEQGKGGDLDTGLKKVDQDIDNALAMSK
ncbi:extracellular solute-binding protein [Cellulomonas sp. P24]|uniref:extracellular solute-binding protein n=1 Tax=Cellulomonas sp. P24 TaxID=2885206 RepID=UPI00216B123A|nr:extracellular solute-binding protein [Cellulomonas sp. P24]MCR6493647.1 extracellular solute-binding protein [Cellulomonas sp. P24]